jgi:hypothetical protein
MLGLRDLDVRRAGSDQTEEIGGVLGLEELRPAAANDRERRAHALDKRDRDRLLALGAANVEAF